MGSRVLIEPRVPISERKGLFVDLDGTLADTLPSLRHTYAEFLTRHDRVPSDAEFLLLSGPPLSAVVRFLKQRHGLPQSDSSLLDEYTSILSERYAAAPPAPGAHHLLSTAKATGRPIALVTSCANATARGWLSEHGLASLVDVVVGGDDVKCGKPDPQPYLRALALTECTGPASVAVEDSLAGLLAATSAGIPALLVGVAPCPATSVRRVGDLYEAARHL
jgi:HAD superfamily hydrolase (TIGR01509 family)